MKIQKTKTEREYRAVDALSYSAIKTYIDDRKKFYSEYILGEPRKQDDSYAVVLGCLVETLLWESDRFDEKFVLASVNPPVGQMLDLVTNLHKVTVMCMSEDGEVTRDFDAIFRDAFDMTKYDRDGIEVKFKGKKVEKILEDFEGSDAELYYKQLRQATGKNVVSLSMMTNAENKVAELKSNFATRDVLNIVSGSEVEVHNQFPIEFEYRGQKMKSLIDHFEINHKEKWLKPYDLKVSWEVENFEYNYLKFMYYIQNAVYYNAVHWWAINNGFQDYTVHPLSFIVGDSTNYNNPIIHETSMQDVYNATTGFYIRGKYYKGLDEAIDEIAWSTENGIWNIPMKAHKNNGRLKLNVRYDN